MNLASILVTGGAGFIGANFIFHLFKHYGDDIVIHNVDALTYAGNLESLKDIEGRPNYHFHRVDITDKDGLEAIFKAHKIMAVVNFAAESHVDRSILDGRPFVLSNILGTQTLLDLARHYDVHRFLQVSTDEVYGTLGDTGEFVETMPLEPNSPYAASKAGADVMVRAYFETHGLATLITRCSNNYGPYQFPEKLIPLMISNAVQDKELPVYGDGRNVRDWLHVSDHCRAILAVLREGTPGEVYNVGGGQEMRNIDLVTLLLKQLGKPDSLIRFVKDRPGHDFRYAIDYSKLNAALNWKPEVSFEDGLADTIRWYRENDAWLSHVKSGAYRDYYKTQYANRADA